MTQEEIKDIMDACGNEVCREYCPWADMDHAPGSSCEGTWCEDACEAFIEENQEYFDKETSNENKILRNQKNRCVQGCARCLFTSA